MADMRERLIITANIANSRELASDDRLIWDIFLRAPLAGRSRFTLTPDRIVIRQQGCVVAEHPRCYGRGEMIYDPWHYVPILGSVGIRLDFGRKDALLWVPSGGLGQQLAHLGLAPRRVGLWVVRASIPTPRTNGVPRPCRPLPLRVPD
jgi:hypothetical protein